MKYTTLILLALAMVVVGCGMKGTTAPLAKPSEGAAAQEDVKPLFEASCGKCHGVGKVAKFKEAVPWKSVVDRMITARGAKITPEDAAKITAYLEKTYPQK